MRILAPVLAATHALVRRGPPGIVMLPRGDHKNQARPHGVSGAFTLTETLVVIGVIGLLLSMTAAVIQRVRESANRTVCAANLRQLGLAVTLFHDDYGYLPPSVVWEQRLGRRHPFSFFPWTTNILPYIDEGPVWLQSLDALRQTGNTLQMPPHSARTHVVKLFVCPTDRRLYSPQVNLNGVEGAFSSYLGVSGGSWDPSLIGIMGGSFATFSDVLDGLSNTVMIGERPPPDNFLAGWWYTTQGDGKWKYRQGPSSKMPVRPVIYLDPDCRGEGRYGPGRTDNPCDRWHYWSMHPGGANWLFGDCTVRFLRYDVEPILPALASRAGSELVEIPD